MTVPYNPVEWLPGLADTNIGHSVPFELQINNTHSFTCGCVPCISSVIFGTYLSFLFTRGSHHINVQHIVLQSYKTPCFFRSFLLSNLGVFRVQWTALGAMFPVLNDFLKWVVGITKGMSISPQDFSNLLLNDFLKRLQQFTLPPAACKGSHPRPPC